jgi:hypothetical protein
LPGWTPSEGEIDLTYLCLILRRACVIGRNWGDRKFSGGIA